MEWDNAACRVAWNVDGTGWDFDVWRDGISTGRGSSCVTGRKGARSHQPGRLSGEKHTHDMV